MISTCVQTLFSSPHKDTKWSTSHKTEIWALKCCTNLSNNKIFAQCEISKQTDYNLLKNDFSHCSEKTKSDKSLKINSEMMQRMIKHINDHYSKCIMSWQNLKAKFEIKIMKQTIQHAMKKYEYKKCKIVTTKTLWSMYYTYWA